jgi:hypothetical protein
MSAATTQLSGFVGKIARKQKQTRFGVRPITSLSIGIRDKATDQVAWDTVNIWGTPDVKKGDVLTISDVKQFGRSKYGKIADHQARNKRDRKAEQVAQEARPKQLALF